MGKDRLHYIDIAKGILILLVVVFHTSWQADVTGVTNPIFQQIGKFGFLASPFYMSAFFAITGYCANFDKPYIQFLLADIKTLLLPSVSLCLVAACIRYAMMGEWDFSWVAPRYLIRFLSLHWFLPALFWAKQLHFWFRKFKLNSLFLFLIYLLFAVLGLYIVGHFKVYWWFAHGLMFVIYIHFGSLIKDRPILSKFIYFLLYLCYVLIMRFIFGSVPWIASETHLRVWQMPLFVLSSGLGTLSILWVSQKIERNGFLEWLGRNSLVIYCLHFTLMNDFYRLFIASLNTLNTFQSIYALLLMYAMIIGICGMASWVLNLKYFKWILGKF